MPALHEPAHGGIVAGGLGNYARIYAVVKTIPRGRVATYGQVARLAGLPGHARQVGYAMAALQTGVRVPWQRVINAQGRVSLRRAGAGAGVRQRQLLEREGVVFGPAGKVSLVEFGWDPRARRRGATLGAGR